METLLATNGDAEIDKTHPPMELASELARLRRRPDAAAAASFVASLGAADGGEKMPAFMETAATALGVAAPGLAAAQAWAATEKTRLEAAVADARENEGESEVRAALHALSQHAVRTEDCSAAVKAIETTAAAVSMVAGVRAMGRGTGRGVYRRGRAWDGAQIGAVG